MSPDMVDPERVRQLEVQCTGLQAAVDQLLCRVAALEAYHVSGRSHGGEKCSFPS